MRKDIQIPLKGRLTVFCDESLRFVVYLPYHLRRFLVALAVYVPQDQDCSSPGELLGEQPPEAAPGPSDHAHLSRHALLLGSHDPSGPGCHKRPEHLQDNHEELRDDQHHLGRAFYEFQISDFKTRKKKM